MDTSSIKPDKDIGRFDILQILKAIWQKKLIVALSTAAGAVIALVYTIYFIAPVYQASVIFYVNNANISLGSSSISISPSELTAAKNLVDTYIVILKTPETLDEIIDVSGLDYSTQKLSSIVSANSMNSTEIFKVAVTGTNTDELLILAESISSVLPDRISRIVEGSDVRIVNHARVASSRVSPSYTTNTAIGFLAGLFISLVVTVLIELCNNTVRAEEYLTQLYTIPILTVVPNGEKTLQNGKYGYYGKGKKHEKKR